MRSAKFRSEFDLHVGAHDDYLDALLAVLRGKYDLNTRTRFAPRARRRAGTGGRPPHVPREEEARELARARIRDVEFTWATFLVRGMEQGVLPEADPRLLTRALLGLYNSIWHWYRPRGQVSLEEVDGVLHEPAAARCSACRPSWRTATGRHSQCPPARRGSRRAGLAVAGSPAGSALTGPPPAPPRLAPAFLSRPAGGPSGTRGGCSIPPHSRHRRRAVRCRRARRVARRRAQQATRSSHRRDRRTAAGSGASSGEAEAHGCGEVEPPGPARARREDGTDWEFGGSARAKAWRTTRNLRSSDPRSSRRAGARRPDS